MCPFNTQVDEADLVFETLDGVTDGSGEGFNTLAGYLFGNNTQEVCYDHEVLRACVCVIASAIGYVLSLVCVVGSVLSDPPLVTLSGRHVL